MLVRRWIRAASSFTGLSLLAFNYPLAAAVHNDNDRWYVAAPNMAKVRELADGSGIVVAVIDTGVDQKHSSIERSVLPGADFSQDENQSMGDGRTDVNGHGTGMASLIAGHATVEGIAPGAKILPIRVKVDEDVISDGSSIAVATGIRWAVDHGANVINLSLGSSVRDPRELAAIQYALSQNVVVVAAAGNANQTDRVLFPANQRGVIAVCATDSRGQHSSSSVSGPEIVLCAPGEGILRAGARLKLVLGTGTSDSAAIVSGVVALILQTYPGITPSEVMRRLTATADDLGPPGRDDLYGYGVVNPLKALAMALTPASATRQAPSNPVAESDDHHGALAWLVLSAVGIFALAIGLTLLVSRRTAK